MQCRFEVLLLLNVVMRHEEEYYLHSVFLEVGRYMLSVYYYEAFLQADLSTMLRPQYSTTSIIDGQRQSSIVTQ